MKLNNNIIIIIGITFMQGWLKSAILGGSSYKDLGLSLGGV